jgi:hypothetical protein
VQNELVLKRHESRADYFATHKIRGLAVQDSLHKSQGNPQEDDEHMEAKLVQETARASHAVRDLRMLGRIAWGGGVHSNLFPFHEIIHSFHGKIRLSIYNL